jgi:hypothetical protein
MKTQLMNALMVGALLTTPTSFATSYASNPHLLAKINATAELPKSYASNPHLLAKVYAADFKAR